MEYTPSGLMTRLTDPRGGVHSFEHDAAGRLTRDEDPENGVQTLSRTAFADGYEVTRTTALGPRDARSRCGGCDTGGLRLRDDRPERRDHHGGVQAGRLAGRHLRRRRPGRASRPGPTRAGTTRSRASSRCSVTTPGGRTETTTHTSEATLATAGDPLSVQTLARHDDDQRQDDHDRLRRVDPAARPAPARRGGSASPCSTPAAGSCGSSPVPGLDPLVFTLRRERPDERRRRRGPSRGPSSATRAGAIVARTDADGRRTEFAYDDADRVTEMTVPSDRVYGFDYDRNGNRTARHDAGRRRRTASATRPATGSSGSRRPGSADEPGARVRRTTTC